ncbi:Rhodanese-like protein [Eremomyces bilateralis CBS 781.70]|uniref:Rhodanese-like protein n=1 Tax=Eremomyces bilateralis CBS 781.70 TaxID=1392243 RepID=A0A6G1G633_9PEZI|nr:Rhodanese-like protein [Eremomyces bilateralis CBS 781.70]KAF1813386.1 Rhodanese-like protein [Eremomyces bilateralis CBS 781.70]
MSTISISTLQRISPSTLASRLSSLQAPLSDSGSSIAVIDVRDSDYIGGHILGCQNVPYANLDWKMPELVRELKNKDTVVFHCALSQQRGPSAALQYLRERERLLSGEAGGEKNVQEVVVLDGGFTKWQETYGTDEKLTEGYLKDIWAFGG